MLTSSLYKQLLADFEEKLTFLPDKPEENPQSTLAALWCAAAGTPLSVESAISHPLEELNTVQQAKLLDLVEQRMAGIPLAHLTGRQQFMGIELLTSADALIPRKETEILGNAAVRLLQQIMESVNNPRVLDVCTGAGNLVVAMALHCPRCKLFASDLSPDAVSLARRNAAFHGLSERIVLDAGDLFVPFAREEFFESFDLVTCNPPYISTVKVCEMDDEISNHEPSLAFDGGSFGIKILHRFIQETPKFLKAGGWVAFEVGLGQGKTLVKRMEKKYPYSEVIPVDDERGDIRVILARRK
jgi:release factor glutamine methyltransferase